MTLEGLVSSSETRICEGIDRFRTRRENRRAPQQWRVPQLYVNCAEYSNRLFDFFFPPFFSNFIENVALSDRHKGNSPLVINCNPVIMRNRVSCYYYNVSEDIQLFSTLFFFFFNTFDYNRLHRNINLMIKAILELRNFAGSSYSREKQQKGTVWIIYNNVIRACEMTIVI